MTDPLKLPTITQCLDVGPEIWATHVQAYRDRAREESRLALNADDEDAAEHWRLHAHILELDPRDWHPYGALDRWDGTFPGGREDCSCSCAYYRPLSGTLGDDWGVCTSPVSHRTGKLTFEHQGCYAFEPDPDWLADV